MELFHNFCRRDTDGADKQLRLLFDDDVDEIVKLAFGVVVVCLPGSWAQRRDEQIDSESCGDQRRSEAPQSRGKSKCECRVRTEVGRRERRLELLDDPAKVFGSVRGFSKLDLISQEVKAAHV